MSWVTSSPTAMPGVLSMAMPSTSDCAVTVIVASAGSAVRGTAIEPGPLV